MIGAIFALRAIERAARTVGAEKVTGEAVYNAVFGAPFLSSDLMGISGDLTFTKEAPFPAANLRVHLSTVKDGKLQLATPEWVAAPAIPKW